MKNATGQYFYSVFRQLAQEFRRTGDKFGAMLLRTPLPKVMVVCITLALLIILIPLLITLFLAFLLLRLLLALVFMNKAAGRSKSATTIYVEHRSDRQ